MVLDIARQLLGRVARRLEDESRRILAGDEDIRETQERLLRGACTLGPPELRPKVEVVADRERGVLRRAKRLDERRGDRFTERGGDAAHVEPFRTAQHTRPVHHPALNA